MTTTDLMNKYNIDRCKIDYLTKVETDNLKDFIFERSCKRIDLSEIALKQFDEAFDRRYVRDGEEHLYVSLLCLSAEYNVSTAFLKTELEKLGKNIKLKNKKYFVNLAEFESVKNEINYAGYYDFKNQYYIRSCIINKELVESEAQRIKKTINLMNQTEKIKPYKKIDKKESLFKIGLKPNLVEQFLNQDYYFAY